MHTLMGATTLTGIGGKKVVCFLVLARLRSSPLSVLSLSACRHSVSIILLSTSQHGTAQLSSVHFSSVQLSSAQFSSFQESSAQHSEWKVLIFQTAVIVPGRKFK